MPAAKAKTAKTTKPKKKSAARKRAASGVQLNDALATAAWTQADRALAEALALYDEALQAEGAARDLALEMLGQSLTAAGRKRGLSRLGELGGREAFDPDRHEFIKPPKKTPKSVRIVARGVVRGAEMLTKARVGPVGRAKSR
jgi:hypothetical protein